MRWALLDGKERILATRDNVKAVKYVCECCNEEVIGRQCYSKASHLAHKAYSNCIYNDYQRNMTPWHRCWQMYFDWV